MGLREDLAEKPFLQLLSITGIGLISVLIFSVVGGVLAMVFFGIDLEGFNNYGDPEIIAGLKLFQLLSAVGLFIIPPVVFGFIMSKKPFRRLGFTSAKPPVTYLLVILLMVISAPFVSWLIDVNAAMVLPDFMSGIEEWMRDSERQAEELTMAFLTFDGVPSLLYILLIVAIVPAVGEELLFRGVLQKIMIKWTKSAHWGIWITAILFSAMHMQFFGFFPRLLLGLLFGYLFLWSKSLWLPILGHFINNGTVVIASYMYPESLDNADISIFSESNYSYVFYIGSFVLTALVLWWIRRFTSTNEVDNQNGETIGV